MVVHSAAAPEQIQSMQQPVGNGKRDNLSRSLPMEPAIFLNQSPIFFLKQQTHFRYYPTYDYKTPFPSMSLSIQSIIYPQSLAFFLLTTVVHAAREDLIAIIQRLNSDLLELRNEIEYSISNRCASIAGCSKSSYHECQSEYTRGQTCPAFEKYGAWCETVVID